MIDAPQTPAEVQRDMDLVVRVAKETARRRLMDGDDTPPVFRVFDKYPPTTRYFGAHGGRGAAKSWEFGRRLLRRCLTRQTRAVCVREVQASLEQSVKKLLEDLIALYHLEDDFDIKDTLIRGPHGSLIIFQGMQNHTADSIKSLEGYDIAWVEEAQSLSARSLMLLRPTIRKEIDIGRADGVKEYSQIWFSWNPRNADDPVDAFLRGENKVPGAIVVQCTYMDNPFFPDVLRAEMEWDRSVDIENYTHVWLGGYEKHSEARVFKNWRIEDFVTPAGVYYLTGADWGYSVDPTTLVRSFESIKDPDGNPWMHTGLDGVARPRKRLYIDADLYRVGVELENIPAFFDEMGPVPRMMRTHSIIADSSRPDTISYVRRHGYPGIEAAKKGANSIKEGVIFLQSYQIIIHSRCVNAIKEFTDFSFKRDPMTGKITNVLEDKKNHIIDPVRYSVEQLRGALMVKKAVWG